MKRKLEIIMALILSVCMILPISASAESRNTGSIIGSTVSYDDQIIGQSITPTAMRIPNILTVNWVASATQVIITVTNIGIDTVDTFAGTVVVQGGSSSSFSIASITPLSTRTIYVNLNMLKCYESITVNYYGIDGGTEFGQGSSPGHREIPSTLSSYWIQGASATVYASINYHFGTHGTEVSSTNIVDYATKAANYRNEIVSDIANLSTESLNNKYTITVSIGATVAHKYKNKSDARYAILSDAGYQIVSFGR